MKIAKKDERSLVYVGTKKGGTVYFSMGIVAAYANHKKEFLYVASRSDSSPLYDKHIKVLIEDLQEYEIVWSNETAIRRLVKY